MYNPRLPNHIQNAEVAIAGSSQAGDEPHPLWQRFFQLIIFLCLMAALALRFLILDQFLTQDEHLWVMRSQRFAQSLSQGDFLGTAQTGHPGVTTMWLGSLGLWLHALFASGGWFAPSLLIEWCTLPAALLPYMRAPVALITLAALPLVYFLLRQLVGRAQATVALLLLLLDPYLIAHSRLLHHDALVATFMLVSCLALIVHLLRGQRMRYYWLSALFAALAFLSKSTALFMGAYAAVLFALPLIPFSLPLPPSERFWPAFTKWLRWGLVVVLAVFILWPALWVGAPRVLWNVFGTAADHAQSVHTQGVFFWGEATPEPNIAYYPTVLLMRTSPLVLVGLIAGAIFAGISIIQRRRPLRLQMPLFASLDGLSPQWLFLLYVFAYLLFVTIAAKKQERYMLPALLMCNILAAGGLVYVWQRVASDRLQRWAAAPLALFALVSLVPLLTHHPYYLTYYNPLLGGHRVAPRIMTIGWGEGLDEAARYLNNQPAAANLRATLWPVSTFSPFFSGNTLLYGRETPENLWHSDYVVLYVSELQRGYPSAELHEQIRRRGTLEKVIRINEIDYAWVYRMPDNAANRAEMGATWQITPSAAFVGEIVTISPLEPHNRAELPTKLVLGDSSTAYTLPLQWANSSIPASHLLLPELATGRYCLQPEQGLATAALHLEAVEADAVLCNRPELSPKAACIMIQSYPH